MEPAKNSCIWDPMGAPTTITYCLALLALLPISAHAQPGNDSQPRSLTVEQAVQVGLRSNPELHAMDAEVRMATAETGMARAMTRFQVSTTTYLGTGTMPNILSTSPGVQPTNNNLVPKQSFVTQNVTLMAPLYTGGRLSGTVRAAQAQEQATTEDRKEMRLQVALRLHRVLSGGVADAHRRQAGERLRHCGRRHQRAQRQDEKTSSFHGVLLPRMLQESCGKVTGICRV